MVNIFEFYNQLLGVHKMNLQSLNGWQRLWIVAMLLYGIVVAWVTVSALPSKAAVEKVWAAHVLDAFANDLATTSGKSFSAEGIRSIKAFKEKSDEQIAQEITSTAASLDLTQPDKQDLLGYKKMIGTLEVERQQNLQSVSNEQLKTLVTGFAVWLLPSMAMLLFGYLVAWVYRGFKRQSNAH
jgi:hypothetical protein